MTNPIPLGAGKGFDLTQLNAWVVQNEENAGPIIAIGDGGSETTGQFDADLPPLTSKFAKVDLKVGATCVVAPGRTLVCEGQAYLSNVLTDVCVTRPT